MLTNSFFDAVMIQIRQAVSYSLIQSKILNMVAVFSLGTG